jgi:hypothetical protein
MEYPKILGFSSSVAFLMIWKSDTIALEERTLHLSLYLVKAISKDVLSSKEVIVTQVRVLSSVLFLKLINQPL